MFFLIDILTFPAQLLKGSWRCPGGDSELWTKMCQSPSRCVSPEPAVPLCCFCWCCCLWPFPAHSQRHSPTAAVHGCALPWALWGRPCAVRDSSAHTHTHRHSFSFPAFPHYPSALNCTQGFGQDPRNAIYDTYSWYWLCILSVQDFML